MSRRDELRKGPNCDISVCSKLFPSFDHLVGKLWELRWYIKAECRGGLEVDHQIELLRPLYRQVTWLGTVQDFRDVIPASSEQLGYVRPVSNQDRRLLEIR